MLFVNNSNLPILVEGWHIVNNNLTVLIPVQIEPNEEKQVYSITRQWNVTTYFTDIVSIKKWKNKNLDIGEIIGTFRSIPSYSGQYTFIRSNKFNMIYDTNKIIFFSSLRVILANKS